MKPPSKRQKQALADRKIDFDLACEHAHFHLIAALAWPRDAKRRQQAVATLAADLLGALKVDASHYQNMRPDERTMAADRLTEAATGFGSPDLQYLPSTRAMLGRMIDSPTEAARGIFYDVFDPAGGFKAVADAPGCEVILREVQAVSEDGAFHAGRLLIIVMTLARLHPDIPASWARALVILECQMRAANLRVLGGRRLKDLWKEWRCAAPLWGAMQIAAAEGPGGARISAWEIFNDPARLRLVLGYTAWLRDFAVRHMAPNSDTVLIPPDEAIEINAAILPVEPPPIMLGPEELRAARSPGRGGIYEWNPLNRG